MIAVKNSAMTTVTVATMTDRKARGLGNFVDADQITASAADPTL
jgi:hypothetical protein